MTIKINHEIPRTMTLAGLEFLGNIAKSVPENGIIVEVGPLYGSSTWVLSKNSHPSVKIFSLDTWGQAAWIDKFRQESYPDALPFGLDAFKFYTKDCPNVTPIVGWSPDSVKRTWSEPIDMFFDDGSHGNPGFINNLTFFEAFLKQGGIACGDDFASGSPDIIDETGKLAERWNCGLEVIGRVWALRKPRSGEARTTVYGEMPFLESAHPHLETYHASGSKMRVDNPSSWVGRLHKNDPMTGLKVGWAEALGKPQDISLAYQCRDGSGGTSEWVALGEECRTPDGGPVMAARFALSGPGAGRYVLAYQAGFCYPRIGRQLKASNSGTLQDGAWVDHKSGYPLNALRLTLRRKPEAKPDRTKDLAA